MIAPVTYARPQRDANESISPAAEARQAMLPYGLVEKTVV
jgi:hypothetical protein